MYIFLPQPSTVQLHSDKIRLPISSVHYKSRWFDGFKQEMNMILPCAYFVCKLVSHIRRPVEMQFNFLLDSKSVKSQKIADDYQKNSQTHAALKKTMNCSFFLVQLLSFSLSCPVHFCSTLLHCSQSCLFYIFIQYNTPFVMAQGRLVYLSDKTFLPSAN